MGLGDLARKMIGAGAPILGGLLGGPAGAAVTKIVAGRLGVRGDADEIAAALDRDPAAAVRLREIEADQAVSLERVALESEASRLAAATHRVSEASRIIRKEIASDDAFVRRGRPAIAWSAAISLFGLKALAAVVFLWRSEMASAFIEFMRAITPIIVIELTAAGYYVSRRSRDKQVAAGQDPGPGLFGALAGKLAR